MKVVWALAFYPPSNAKDRPTYAVHALGSDNAVACGSDATPLLASGLGICGHVLTCAKCLLLVERGK